ncbi:MAG: GerMN domain-containing protein [Actinobacteria bacterium]|nr:GerMN domain-containing protein [Actinomycetota bacterium]
MRGKIGPLLGLALASLLCLLLVGSNCACWRTEGNRGDEPVESDGAERGDGETAEVGTVEVTLYFRYDTPEGSWLAPEKRMMEGAEPCRAAMEALIAGPGQGSSLKPVLPNTVRVLETAVEGGICTLNVSGEIITDAAQVGVSASGEMLALAAIANTLTGLAGVEKVRLLVEGLQSGMVEGRFVEDFWGHVGLPEYLERNERLIYGGA